MYRQILCMLGVTVAAGCQQRAGAVPVAVVDLVRELPRAEARPPSGFSVVSYERHADARPAIAATVPSRLTIAMPLPRRGLFSTAVAVESLDPSAAVRFRVGVSDHRIYEGIEEMVVTGQVRGWIDLRADLSAYAGFKWSLFYRPDRIVWHVVLAADPVAAAPARALWGTPRIVADQGSAREYLTRRARLRREAAHPGPD